MRNIFKDGKFQDDEEVQDTEFDSFDQRHSKRVYCELPVQLQINGAILSGLMKNISCGGIFIQASDELEDEKGVEVILHLPNEETPLKLSSEVVWSGPPSQLHSQWQLGIRFLDLLPEDERRIQEFLEWNTKENVN